MPTCYSPGRHCTCPLRGFLVRLACVKRAASVDSEPGSNSRLILSSTLIAPLPNPNSRGLQDCVQPDCQKSTRPRGDPKKPARTGGLKLVRRICDWGATRNRRQWRPALIRAFEAGGRSGFRDWIPGRPPRSLTIWLDAQVNFAKLWSWSETAIDSMRSNESLIPAQNQRWRRA